MRELIFEGTAIAFAVGQIDAETAEAMCIGVNAQGVMASGHAGIIRLAAGPEIERELRVQAPLLVGDAYLTGPGNLAARGVRLIAAIVVSDMPGAPVQRAALERGLDRALELLDREGVRELVIPDLGLRIPNVEMDSAAAILAVELARRLRRGAALQRVTVVSLHAAYLRAVRERLLASGASDS
jgi:O-acetyl-ADP-ribose deacetylase (regulator of RNase III)